MNFSSYINKEFLEQIWI